MGPVTEKQGIKAPSEPNNGFSIMDGPHLWKHEFCDSGNYILDNTLESCFSNYPEEVGSRLGLQVSRYPTGPWSTRFSLRDVMQGPVGSDGFTFNGISTLTTLFRRSITVLRRAGSTLRVTLCWSSYSGFRRSPLRLLEKGLTAAPIARS